MSGASVSVGQRVSSAVARWTEPPSSVVGTEHEARTRFIIGLLLAMMPIAILGVIVLLVTLSREPAGHEFRILGMLLLIFPANLVSLRWARQGRTEAAGILLVLTGNLVVVGATFAGGTVDQRVFPIFFFPIILLLAVVVGDLRLLLAVGLFDGAIVLWYRFAIVDVADSIMGNIDLFYGFTFVFIVSLALVQGIYRRELTERTEALRDSDDRLRGLLRSVSEVLLVTDGQYILDAGGPAQRLLGRTEASLIGEPLASVLPASLVVEVFAGEALPQAPVTVRLDGPVQDAELEVHETNLVGAGRYAVSLRDITARVAAEAVLRDVETQFAQSQKMEAVGRLAGGVAHDFNNILTVITSLSEFALMEADEGTDLHADLSEIKVAGERAAAVTSQLLAFSRRQVLSPEIVDVAATLRSSRSMLHHVLTEACPLDLTVPEGTSLTAELDVNQFQQILINLVANARDAMEDGGRLSIRLEAADTPPPGFETGAWLRLVFEDEGPGVPETIQLNMFEPFFSTKEVGKGTGLGLSTALGIAVQSGGTITYAQAERGGAEFTVWLPRAEGETSQVASGEVSVELTGTTGTILFVEDEPGVRAVGERILVDAGHTVLVAGDAEAALGLWEAEHESIQALVTDVVMPGLNGRELAERILNDAPELPVLFLSGHTEDEVARRGIEVGELRFLRKPYPPDRLVAEVDEMLSG